MNSSTSKALWSIPKAKRFEDQSTKKKKVDAIYDVPNKIYRNQRATSFGVGERLFDLGQGKKTTGP